MSKIQNIYSRKLDILNRGFSGYNTKQVLKVIDNIIHQEFRKYCVLSFLFLGANDACVQGPRKVDLVTYKQNIIDLALKLKQTSPIIIITPPPVGTRPDNDRSYENTLLYRNACLDAASELNVPYIDTWSLFLGEDLKKDQQILDHVFNDGLHLSSKGNELLFDKIIDTVQKEYPHLAVDNMPLQPPLWSDFL